MEQIRLQKYLADAGIASRRKAEELIKQGKVYVNHPVFKSFLRFYAFFPFVFDISLSFPIPSMTRRLRRGLVAFRRPYFYRCAFSWLVSLCPQASTRRVRHVQPP